MASKYDAITRWLLAQTEDSVRVTLSELNQIVLLPPCVYHDRSSWGNCTTANASNFVKGWINAGFRVSAINLDEQWVEFSRSDMVANYSKAVPSRKQKSSKLIPTRVEEEILLTTQENLLVLQLDKYMMVCLNKHNSDIVEECIKYDPIYQSKGKAIMERYFGAGDYSPEAYYEIINRIATENSTRTSKKTMEILANYCADTSKGVLERLQGGCPQLVDDMLQHMIDHGGRRDKSLASKVCRYLNEWLYGGCAYTINDSVVRAVLPYYLAFYEVDKMLWKNKDFEELCYVEFYHIFSALREQVGVLNNHQLDHLIWYTYKSDNIRKEIAKALAQIL